MDNKGSELSLGRKIKNLNRVQKIVLLLTVAVILYSIFGFLVLPPILKMLLEKRLPEALHRQSFIQKIKITPYTLTAAQEGVAIRKPGRFRGFYRL